MCGGSTALFIYAYCFYYWYARSDMNGEWGWGGWGGWWWWWWWVGGWGTPRGGCTLLVG